MKNLSLKERFLLIAVGVALLIAIAYIGVIMPVNNKIDEKRIELDKKIALDKQYDEIKKSNNELRIAIDETKADIEVIENSFFADTDIDVIENYVMNIFEQEGSYYLSNIESVDITPEDIYLPNGVIATEKLLVKRLSIEYATTDGYTIPEYNGRPVWIDPLDMETSTATLAGAIAQMGNYDIVGYKEFVSGCEIISKAHPNCIKVHKLSIEDSKNGFLYLRAEVDIYSTMLGNSRLSQTNTPEQVALEWTGRAKAEINCGSGLIGMPIICWDEGSEWFMCQISYGELKEFRNRPASSWFSNAMLTEIAKNKLPLFSDYDERISTASEMYEIKDKSLENVPAITDEN